MGHRPIRSLADRGKYGSAPPEAAVAEALKAALLKASKPVPWPKRDRRTHFIALESRVLQLHWPQPRLGQGGLLAWA